MTTKRHRLRRFAKWAGLVACIVAIAISVMGMFYWAAMYRRGWMCVVGWGCVTVQSTNASYGNEQEGFRFAKRRTGEPVLRFWWVRILHPGPGSWAVIVPLWIPTVALAIPTVILFRRDRRHPPGYCQACGYNLTGNESGRCPECGTDANRTSGSP